ncbi:SAM-dependent methyltransferase [Pedobacter nutrimenti]|uniref:Cyclopropane-fatty-acyl-phospholipid synthase n=1 Tax=Pedobacter nutrimenti TaxID=1241337 RepID=A0A318UCU4_9SPHI|nr:cyclopropane-fatty-acyl-phospholipid synthase family protein [Pedobacter nutrimenti]PYF74262.1 cyclopropane-fatty-acyl-phospholipid synthase [Pedobacter nutrimenti]
MWYDTLIEQNKLPDFVLRAGIRKLLKERLQDECLGDVEVQQHAFNELMEELKNAPIAVNTREANEQHYEIPAAFYQYCLGRHLKYSSGYWKPGVIDLDISEEDMLELTCQRAGLQQGQSVLELGCGWGSLSLFMSAKYPGSKFTVVSNSSSQKAYIDATAKQRGLTNLLVITADMNTFDSKERFDRVVSVEMFEHMRNYQLLLQKVASFLKKNGKLFVHIFTHQTLAYKFEVKNDKDWMSKNFFTGGIMPSNHLLFYFNDDLKVSRHWVVNGMHYSKTAEAWLSRMDAHKTEIMTIFEQTYGAGQALKWWAYWRLFYMSCAELFAYNKGNEWMVCHYVLEKNSI